MSEPETTIEIARQIGSAGTRFSCHNWRFGGCRKSGRLGGRPLPAFSERSDRQRRNGRRNQPQAWNKFKPARAVQRRRQKFWNEAALSARISALALRDELFCCRTFLKDGRGQAGGLFHTSFQSRLDVSRMDLRDRGLSVTRKDRDCTLL